jgi:Flp pilus assembly pilin Flp
MKPSKIYIRLLKGASIVEYMLMIAAVAVAVIGMSVYLKRAVSGKWKQSVDVFGYGRQYDPNSTKTLGSP